jgi:hypothetical protein
VKNKHAASSLSLCRFQEALVQTQIQVHVEKIKGVSPSALTLALPSVSPPGMQTTLLTMCQALHKTLP